MYRSTRSSRRRANESSSNNLSNSNIRDSSENLNTTNGAVLIGTLQPDQVASTTTAATINQCIYIFIVLQHNQYIL